MLHESTPRLRHARERLDDHHRAHAHETQEGLAQPAAVDAQHTRREEPRALGLDRAQMALERDADLSVGLGEPPPAQHHPPLDSLHQPRRPLSHVAESKLVELRDATCPEEDFSSSELVEMARHLEAVEHGGGEEPLRVNEGRQLEHRWRMLLQNRPVTVAYLAVGDARGVAMLEQLAALEQPRVTKLHDGVFVLKEAGLHQRVGLNAPDEVAARQVKLVRHCRHLAEECEAD
mmetsp:Transcript_12275/g.24642  ORF Transcript_12275/g.24642 Transcript_12275/m.24642 type:complete len:233 (-) Transcript_12275:924-1622(-)